MKPKKKRKYKKNKGNTIRGIGTPVTIDDSGSIIVSSESTTTVGTASVAWSQLYDSIDTISDKPVKHVTKKRKKNKATMVFVNGLRMQEDIDYTINDKGKVEFKEIRAPGDSVVIDTLGKNGYVEEQRIYGREFNEEFIERFFDSIQNGKHKLSTSKAVLRRMISESVDDNLKAVELVEKYNLGKSRKNK